MRSPFFPLTVMVLSLLPVRAFGLSCRESTFFENAAYADLVVYGQVTAAKDGLVTLTPIRFLKGSDHRGSIDIFFHGWSLWERHVFDRIRPGDFLVFAAQKEAPSAPDRYVIELCQVPPLRADREGVFEIVPALNLPPASYTLDQLADAVADVPPARR